MAKKRVKKLDKSFLLKMALAATEKNEAVEERYARNKTRVKMESKIQKLPNGDYKIPSNMSGASYKKMRAKMDELKNL